MVRRRRSTIVDIAREVGVSPKTVSRVLNNEPHVKSDLRARVNDVAKRLSYSPNLLAQGLKRSKTYLLGLIYENPSPSYVVDLQMGALERLQTDPFRLVVLPVRSVRDRAAEVIDLLRATALDGVVLAPPAADHLGILEELEAGHLAYARIAPTRTPEFGPCVRLDDMRAARDIAEHLIGLGHRDIGIIKGDPTHPSSEARLIGYSQALSGAGITMRLDRIEQGYFTYQSGYAAARRLLAVRDRPTALLAQNDDMAVAAIMAARELGLEVPRDLSVTGFDDSDISRISWPRLTTVRQPVFEMAYQATDMLIRVIEGGARPEDQVFAHELLIRESTAPPR